MKVIPRDFKSQSKFLRSKISKRIKKRVPPTMLNDFIAKAYGWQHYQDFKKNENNVDLFKKENDLILEKIVDIESQLISNLIVLICIITNNKDYFSAYKKYYEFLLILLGGNIVKQNELEFKNNLYPFENELLRTHVLNLDISEQQRIVNTLKLVQKENKYELAFKNSIWFVDEKEYQALKTFISLLNSNNIENISFNIKTKEDVENFDFSNLKQHSFFIVENRFNIWLEKSDTIFEKYIEELKEEMHAVFNTQSNSNNLDIISEKPKKDLMIYVNADTFQIPEYYAVFIAQCRSFGISSIISSYAYNVLISKGFESTYSIIANSNSLILDLSNNHNFELVKHHITGENFDLILDYAKKNNLKYILHKRGEYCLLDEFGKFSITVTKLIYDHIKGK